MKKRVLLMSAAVFAIAIGVAGFSAFEAHIINVTAQIENALSVDTEPIDFGTVFPQEELDREISVALSGSFMEEGNADDVNYVIRQKPKCILSEALDDNGVLLPDFQPPAELDLFGRVTEDGEEFICEDERYEKLPVLCPYLSKHDLDPDDGNDEEIGAFHGDMDWNMVDTLDSEVAGRLAKSQNDTSDDWNIDLRVPCFEGQCAQDWAEFVAENNPDVVDPDVYVLPTEDEHKLFGCDLWIEVTDISRIPEPEPTNSLLSLENKDDNGWFIMTDDVHGVLEYNSCGSPFDFVLTVSGVMPETNYSLIYYADPWPGSNPGALIWSGDSDVNGDINAVGSVALGINMPDPADANYPPGQDGTPATGDEGAKIWLVPSSDYSPNSMTGWNPDDYLYEYELIEYNQVCS